MKGGEGVADRRLRDVNRRLNEVYSQAVKELEQTLKEFQQKYAARDAVKRQQLEEGKITKVEYDSWKRGQVFQGKQWKAKLDSAAETLVHADEEAVRITNRERGRTFRAAANAELENASNQTGVDFNLYDQSTVDRLLRQQPNLLPPRRVKKAKDSAWYHQQISNAVTRSIIEGDSIDSLARKIARETGESSKKAARRNARTSMTAAQNAGRMESMHKAQDMGIKVQKQWLAAHDSRVRDTHRELDGQTVEVDEPFKVDGMEILYPGDPAADPSLVYNCRCTVVFVYPDYQKMAGAEQEPRHTYSYSDDRSFAASLGGELSPYVNEIPSYEEYREKSEAYTGERTRYIENVRHGTVVDFKSDNGFYGEPHCAASRVDNAVARCQERFPLLEGREKLIICDYDYARFHLPDGESDRRLSSDATAQVFQNKGQTLIAFRREWMNGTLQESLESRAKAIANGGILSSVFPVASPEAIVLHEWGHTVHDYFLDAMCYDDENAQGLWDWFCTLSKDDIRAGISDYAATNFGEFSAECFAEMQTENPRPLAVKYWEFMSKLIARRRGV